MGHFFNQAGQPITVAEWSLAFEDFDARRVRFDTVHGAGEAVDVSTVWVGLDHQFGDGPPLIFESLVFGGPLDGAGLRYATRDEAIEGHAALVGEVRQALEALERARRGEGGA